MSVVFEGNNDLALFVIKFSRHSYFFNIDSRDDNWAQKSREKGSPKTF
jgi:hypothetical protein